jgi:Tol biopolymer transport system component
MLVTDALESNMRRFLILLFAFLITQNCGNKKTTNSVSGGTGCIAGFVRLEDSNEHSSSKIEIIPHNPVYNKIELHPDSTGYFAVDELPAVTYTFKASSLGYVDYVDSDLVIRPGQTKQIDVTLKAVVLLRQLTTNGGFDPSWTSDGKEIVYVNGSGTFKISVDSGTPELIFSDTTFKNWPVFSPNDTKIAYTSLPNLNGIRDIWIYDWNEKTFEKITNDTIGVVKPTWSPDGHYLAYRSNMDGLPHIWKIDLSTKIPEQLTSGSFQDNVPNWSRANNKIVFISDRNGREAIWIMSSNGENPTYVTSAAEFSDYSIGSPSWSADGKEIVYEGSHGLWIVSLEEKTYTQITFKKEGDDFFDTSPSWSPKGDRIAFSSTRNGERQIWIAELR